MSHFIILPMAFTDIREHALYLGREDEDTGIRFVECAEETFEWLAGHPGIGRSREDLSRKLRSVRSFLVEGFPNHLVFYRQAAGGIEILRVLHGARDIRPAAIRKALEP